MFEFQVEQRAEFIPDTTLSIRPRQETPRQAPALITLVSFIVDTLGVPEPQSFKIIREVDTSLARDAQESFGAWRFRPARHQGCLVRQLFQTGLERRR